MSDIRRRVHEMIDQLPPAQLAAVEGLLASMVDPVRAALQNAPFDDEPVTEEDRRRVHEGRRGETVGMDEVLAEFGLSSKDFEK